jgi:hypothetical protein
MTREELKQAAIECLGKAFKGGKVSVVVVQAALSIVLTPDSTPGWGAEPPRA